MTYCNLPNCGVPMPHSHGTDQDSAPECPHHTVVREYSGKDVHWVCAECSTHFVPVSAAQLSHETFEVALDAIAGTMSAVLFDYTERMAERYGIQANDVRTDDTGHDCEADGYGHNYDSDGKCTHCGHSPFLGN